MEEQEVKTVEETKPKKTETRRTGTELELPKLKRELHTARKKLEELHDAVGYLREDNVKLKDKLTYQNSYYRAVLSNLSDQLEILQRQISIATAGGEING